MGGGGDNEVPETNQEKALAAVAAQQYNDYRKNGVPLENAQIERSNPTSSDYAAVEGMANSSVQTAADKMSEQRIANLETSGVNANSGANIMGTIHDSNRVAAAGAESGVKAEQAVTDRGLAQKQQMIAVGRGQATDALDSMARQASNAANAAITDKQLEVQRERDTAASVGTGSGMIAASYTRPASAQRVVQG